MRLNKSGKNCRNLGTLFIFLISYFYTVPWAKYLVTQMRNYFYIFHSYHAISTHLRRASYAKAS